MQMRRTLTKLAGSLIWLAIAALSSPRFALASHWVAGRKSWEFPWYSVAMMMVVPYLVLGLLGLAMYRAMKSRSD